MKRTNLILRCSLVLLTLVAAGGFCQVSAQVKPSDDKTLQELLDEVRMLRQAMQTLQRMSLDTYRSQAMVDQMRIEREEVRRLTTALNEARDLIIKNTAAIHQAVDEQKLLESQIQSEVDPNKRAQLEFELKRSKRGVDLYTSQNDSLKEREQQLSADLNTEKIKLNELEGRLDSLERAIENDRQKLDTEKSAPAKTP